MNQTKILRPIHPNAGLEAIYRRRLYDLIEEMAASVEYWVRAAYRANPPEIAEIAQDRISAWFLRDAIKKLFRRWNRKFNDLAPKLAKYFAVSSANRSDEKLRKMLRDHGISVKWTMTAAMRDVMNASVAENVALIKSIPQQYLTQVEGMVMRSVQTGRDLGQLSKDLREQLGVTKRRAALISRDQSNKINAVFTRARQLEIGVKEAIWLHSRAGRKPRPTHVTMSGKKYDVAKGMWDPDPKVKKFIYPGELINCRCVARSVVPGFR